jgi:LysM repeat protein
MNYIIKSGDSLSKIARDSLGDITLWVEIAKLNKIASPHKIYPGQVISLDIPKRTTIDITSGTPKIISSASTGSSGNGKAIFGWIAGIGLATTLAYAAWKKAKSKNVKQK